MIQNGNRIATYTQGTEIPKNDSPQVSENSLFLLASASKIFTSVMAMKAAKEGKLKLSGTVDDYIDSAPVAWRNITIRQLLSHTDGIPDVFENADYNTLGIEKSEKLDRRSYLDYAAVPPLHFTPGTHTKYGQSGYVLLSVILESAYELPYETILAQKILIPLGMSDTHFFTASDIIGNYKPQIFEPGGSNGYIPFTPNYVYADFATAGICTNLKDMIKFIQALQKHELLDPLHFKQLYTPISGINEFSLGWQYRYKNGKLMTGHTGGWSVVVMHFPNTNASSIFLSSAATESILNTGYQVAEKALEFTNN